MSSYRKKRRAQERRLQKVRERTPLSIGLILIIVLIVLAVGISRTLT